MNRYFLYFFIILVQVLNAKGVSAGTEITNVAYLNYKIDNVTFNLTSNQVVDIVDQKIDMQMLCQESSAVVVGVAEKKRALRFMLSNQGNGRDIYNFTPINGKRVDFMVENTEVYLDNGDGLFSLGDDQLASDVEVPPDGNVTLFLVSNIPDDADKISENGLKVNSTIQGDLLYGEFKKLENFYAVMATQEDARSALCRYEVSHLALDLEKTATLSSDKVYKGTTIHYKIALRLVGKGEVKNIIVFDQIPEGTTYVADSLQLDGVPSGDFNGTAILVTLASIVQEEVSSDPKHQITFDVRVQ